MRLLFRSSLLVGVLLFLSSWSSIGAEVKGYSMVASYISAPEQIVENRVRSVLQAKKIECMTVTGRGASKVTIWVPANQASEARLLLARAIKTEKLQLTLLARKGEANVVVTPDSILESKMEQRSE